MRQELILYPMLGMMVLTAAVWLVMYARRISAMRAVRVPVQTYTTPDKIVELLPESANYAAYNLKNLFELPVVFYALCLFLYVTQSADSAYLIAAWLFCALRLCHSVVHCTSNVVIVRFYCYLAAALVLWSMLGRAVLAQFMA